MLLLQLGAVAGGFLLLAWSADRLVEGAAALARRLRVSSFAIGVVILGFGTSLPELLVSALAAARGSGGIAIGNAFGSNLANIALILGVSALLLPLAAAPELLRRDLPLLLLAAAAAFLALGDLHLTRWEGLLLLAALAGVIAWLVRRRQGPAPILSGPGEELGAGAALALTLLGLALLLASAWALVWGAVGLARAFGVSELLIGLTLIAIGTSLPELAASLAALRRLRDGGLVLGNVVGSNLFNTLGVVGLPAVVRPFAVDAELWPSALLMLALTLLLAVLLLVSRPERTLGRGAGALLLACYAGYLVWMGSTAVGPG